MATATAVVRVRLNADSLLQAAFNDGLLQCQNWRPMNHAYGENVYAPCDADAIVKMIVPETQHFPQHSVFICADCAVSGK